MGMFLYIIFIGTGYFILGVSLWVVICASFKHPLWGLACLIVPMAKPYFLVSYWDEYKKTGICYFSGWAIFMLYLLVALAMKGNV